MERNVQQSTAMATPNSYFTDQPPQTAFPEPARKPNLVRLDGAMIGGVMAAIVSVVVALRTSGASITYFFQPAAAALVLGVTAALILVTTPWRMVKDCARSVARVFYRHSVDRGTLIEEVVAISRTVRQYGILSAEPLAHSASHPFLKEAVLLALDLKSRGDLVLALEGELRMRERQGETDAKALEVAGGFAPTIGILGTVIGLIQVLRNFTAIESVGTGIGTCFVSTIYGLGVANLILLPLAHRIRAATAEEYECREMILEGILCIFDQVHPSLIRARLMSFIRASDQPAADQVAGTYSPASGEQSHAKS
jgi:chemotaxis protein MotA